jgi:hypothetical protein
LFHQGPNSSALRPPEAAGVQNVATRAADLLVNTFGPGKRTIWPGHQITEMGLAKLYRVTGNEQYLSLAKFMLDVRGPGNLPRAGNTYNQSQTRVVDQTEAVGHAVRATYMYSGMADVAALTGDQSYVHAIDRIWRNVVERKLYVTGGIGARDEGEAFGDDYELPNMTAYNETCASVGLDYWNHRLFLLHGDAKYIDVMERTLYNGLISGVSLDGKRFFYPNPLESNGQHERSPWFGVACCPGNITRFLASVPGYVYARRGDDIFVNLFAGGTAEVETDRGRTVKLGQETRYPWDGHVTLRVSPDRARTFAIKLRVPGWAQNDPVPSDLYRFAEPASEPVRLAVNGRAVDLALDRGYATITRAWKAGDVVDLDLPMPVRRIVAHQSVEADRGRVALQRGPIVYAAEWPDNPHAAVRNIVLPDSARLTSEFRADLLNGVQIVKGRAVGLAYDANGAVTRSEQDLVAIPYSTWANRGRGQMIVWLATTDAVARPTPWPTFATTATVTTSPARRNVRAINDGDDPQSSSDPSSYFDWWPRRGTSEWAEYAFAKPSTISQVDVYWFDDTGRGQVRVPASWRLLYRDGEAWKPIAIAGRPGVEKDRYNTVTFAPITTSALRLEVTAQPEFSVGIQEWKVRD